MKALELYKLNPDKYKECLLDLYCEDAKAIIAVGFLTVYLIKSVQDKCNNDHETAENLYFSIDKLWRLPQIQKTYRSRYDGLHSFIDNFDYFMNRFGYIAHPNCKQTDEDRLKLNIRTTKVIDGVYKDFVPEFFAERAQSFRIWDIGGERSERRKWINHLDGKDAIIYVCALSHYFSPLR